MPDHKSVITPKPLEISRFFPALPETVFTAWSRAEHLKNWFSPAGYTVPEAQIDFRPNGACNICMRAPDGQDFWSRGQYLDIIAPERLAFTSSVETGGVVRFTATTTVTFQPQNFGTALTVHQAYEVHDPTFLGAITGAAEGWRTTLDKLAGEITRLQPRSAVHASFTLARHYDASPAQVFLAFTDPQAKTRWFSGGEGYTLLAREMDVRPGGREHVQGRWTSGTTTSFDATYLDIIPDQRLVYAYEMTLDGRKISVSLATVEFSPSGSGTSFLLTEQGVFLDGYDDAGARETGTAILLDRLEAALQL